MKLKRILAGALAAVVSISTVALASLSTASAAETLTAEPEGTTLFEVTYPNGAEKGKSNAYSVGTNTLGITDSGALSYSYWQIQLTNITWPTFEGTPYLSIDATSSGTDQMQICYGADGTSVWNNSLDNKETLPDSGTIAYDLTPVVESGAKMIYVMSQGSAIKFKSIKIIDAVKSEPETTEPETTEPETTEPEGPVQENIDSIEYNFTVTAGTGTLKVTNQKVGFTSFEGTTEVTGNGDYSIKITGMGATGLTNLGFIEGDGFTVTMNNIVVNDKYTFEVGESLTTTKANANGMANVWNDKGHADVVYTSTADGKTATLVGSTSDKVGITLKVAAAAEPETTEPETTEATTEPETDPQPTDPQPTDQPTPGFSFTAGLSFADGGDWTPSTWGDPSVEITGEGEYSLTWDVAAWVAANSESLGIYAAEGCEVFLIDVSGAAEYFAANGVSITVTKILCDGAEIEIKDAINQGDLEENGDWRVSLYNSTNEQGNAIDPSDIYAEEALTVMFKVNVAEGPTEETTEATTEPTTEPCDVTVSLTPDKAYALPGDEVTYTVAVTPNQPLYTLQMFMNMPEGLAYVPESFVMDENAKANLGFDSLDWTEQTLCLNGVGATPNDITNQTVTLGTFKVLATELGAYTPAFDRYEFCDGEYETISYAVAAAPVEYVTEIPTEETTEAPTEATTGEEPTVAPTEAPVTDPTTVAPTTVKPTNAPDEPTTVATTAATTTAPTTSGNNGNKNDTPNTGAQAAVGLSIFMAAGLAGVVAIKKRRK